VGYGNLQQPAPIPNDGPACWDLVIADVIAEQSTRPCDACLSGRAYFVKVSDGKCTKCRGTGQIDDGSASLRAFVLAEMRERHAYGMAKYPCALQPANGRDALADWYQEALDGAVYARQAVQEYGARDMRIPGANNDLVRIRQAYQKQLALVFTIREMIADRDEARAAKSAT